MAEKKQPNRFRCTVTGCNPLLLTDAAQISHHKETGHRTARWPVRSAQGQSKATQRNKTGYYRKYNVGAKSPLARGLIGGYSGDGYACGGQSGEELGQW